MRGTLRRGEEFVRLGAICKEYVGHSGGKVEENMEGEGCMGGGHVFLVLLVPVRQRAVRHPYFLVQL